MLLGRVTPHYADAPSLQSLNTVHRYRALALDDDYGDPQVGLGEGQELLPFRGGRETGQDVYFAAPVVLQTIGLAGSGDDNVHAYRYASRGLALLIWIVHYFLLRPEYKAMKLLGTDPPSPRVAALSAIGLGVVVTAGLIVTFKQ